MSSKLRIASFNLESLDFDGKSGATFADRAASLRPQLERLGADILCLQEVNSQRIRGQKKRSLLALDELLEDTSYKDHFRVTSADSKSGPMPDVHNLVILSNRPITAHNVLHHQHIAPLTYKSVTAMDKEQRDLSVEWDRPILEAEIDLEQGSSLTVLNVHLRAPLAEPISGQKRAPFVWNSVGGWAEGYFVAALKRNGQALELRLELEKLLDQAPDRLVAVCGDFNASDHETALKIIGGAEEDTGNGDLAYRSLTALERSISQDLRYSVLHHGRPQMPDHILATRPLLGHFRHFEIHNETIEDELIGYARVDRSPNSYHAPIVAQFEFD